MKMKLSLIRVQLKGSTMVAYGWAMEHLKHGDNIVLSIMEHHANIVPWHFLREKNGYRIEVGGY